MDRKYTDELIRRGRLPTEQLEPPEDLLSSILEKTSGPACVRAEALLAQALAADLQELDAQLVDAHADSCTGCNALRIVFSQLARDLPAMRELEPDTFFAGELFAMTSRSTSPRRPGPADRMRRLWKQLVQRPRFAWETAYVGALLFWLVLSLPLVSLPQTPASTRAFLPDFSGARSAIQSLREPVSEMSRRVWSSTHQGWSSASSQIQQDVQEHTEDLRIAIDKLEVERGGEALVALTHDAREALHRFIQQDETDNAIERSEP